MGGKTTALWDQDSFAWYTDAGGEGTNQIGSTNSNPSTLVTGTQYRLRYLIQETAGSNQAETPVFELEYRVDPAGGTTFGSWTPIDSDDTYFTAVSSANVTDNGTTTQQIGAGTFNDGEFSYVDATSRAPTNAMAATAGNDEYECEWLLNFASAGGGANYEFRVTRDTGTTMDSTTNTTQVLLGSSEDTCLADDVESNSEVSSPAVGQKHVILANDASSDSEVSSPAVGQTHVLLANDVESETALSVPTAAEGAGTDVLLAENVESRTEVAGRNELISPQGGTLLGFGRFSQERTKQVYTTAFLSNPYRFGAGVGVSLGVISNVLADNVESASAVSSPAVGQVHALLANDVESDSEVSSPAAGQEHALLANDVESETQVSSPAVSESNILLANDVESDTAVSVPDAGQIHALLANDVESESELSGPAVGQTHGILANDVESSSEVSTSAVGQVHALLANDVESASDVSSPAATESNILLAESVESASDVSSPAVGQLHVLLAEDVESASDVSIPDVAQVHGLLADDVESASEVSAPTVVDVPVGADVLLAEDVESASELSSPDIGQVHALLADDVESASEVSNPALSAPIQRKGLGSRKRKRLYVKNGRIVDEREFYTPSIPLPEQVAATLEAQSKSQPAVFRKKLKLKRKPAKEPELTNEDIVAILAIMSAA